jgi:MATE family multidrug resistance protein
VRVTFPPFFETGDPMAPAKTASLGGGRFDSVRIELAELMKLSWPVVLSRLGIMAMGLSDAIVVGRYSATHLGYHALAWAPTSVVVTMCVGLLTGVQVMTSRAIGEGHPERTGAVLRRGLSYGLWIGLASTVVLLIGGPAFLHSIGLEKDLADGATRALLVFSLSLPGYAVSVAASFWLEGLARPGPAAVMMWVANGVNLALDLLLVPGTFGLPALGAVGGACATTGARTFLAVAVLIYIARMPGARELGVFDKPVRDRAVEAEQRRIGFGAGASSVFEVASFAGMNVIAGWIGGLAVAAWAITLNVIAIVFMVPLGLSTAAAVRVGRAYGARDPAGVTRAAAIAFAVTTAFGLLVSLIVWPAASVIARGYTTDAGTLAMAVPALALSCLFLIPDALQVVCAQTLRARGDVWVPTYTHLASYVLVMAPLAWWLAIPMHLGLNGIVWAVIIASFLSAGLLLARFWILTRQRL